MAEGVNDNFVPTTTQVVVVCPRCAQAVILPLVRVDIGVGGFDLSDGTKVVRSLQADITADGPHECPV